LAKAHPVAKAFHAAAHEQTLDGKPLPQSVIDAARLLNASARLDPTLDKTVRPVVVSAALATLLAGVQSAAPQAIAAADAGIVWRTPLSGLSLGSAIQNVGSDLKYEVEKEPLPQVARAGAA
jgi:hypothetical protein